MLTNCCWTLSGIFSASAMVYSQRSSQSVAQGETDFRAFTQAKSFFRNINFATLMLLDAGLLPQNLSKNKRRWIARIISYPLPFVLQILKHHIDPIKQPKLAQGVNFLRDHLEQVAFAIDLAVTAGMIYFSSPFYSAGLMIGFTVEILNSNNLLSEKTRDIWEKSRLLLSFNSVFFSPRLIDIDWLDIGYMAAAVFIFIQEHYLNVPNKPPLEHQLHLKQAQKLIDIPLTELEVDWSHLKFDPKIEVPGSYLINIEESMQKLVDKMETRWNEENLRDLKKRLMLSPRFKAKHLTIEDFNQIPDELAKNEFRNGAHVLAWEISESAIESGGAYIRYGHVQSLLKSTLKILMEFDHFEPYLFQLSLEGGEYCGAGKIEAIENVYKSLLLITDEIPLKYKFYQQLTNRRRDLFEGLYQEYILKIANKLPKGIIDPVDIHFFNLFRFYVEEGLRMHTESLENDMTVKAYCNRVTRKIGTLTADYTLWPYALKTNGLYSPKDLVGEVVSAASDLGFSTSSIALWWQSWFEKENPSNFTELSDGLFVYGKLFDRPITIPVVVHEDPKVVKEMINPDIIKLMLLDMGILKIKGQSGFIPKQFQNLVFERAKVLAVEKS